MFTNKTCQPRICNVSVNKKVSIRMAPCVGTSYEYGIVSYRIGVEDAGFETSMSTSL